MKALPYAKVITSDLTLEISVHVGVCFVKMKETENPCGQDFSHDEMIEFLEKSLAAVKFIKSQTNG